MGPREFHEILPSTQDRAIELARAGASAGTRVVARRQSRGRGRLERRWESPEGGLYCSVVVPRPEQHAGLLPLTVGARLAVGLRTRYGLPMAVKWPNDVLVADAHRPARKLSGILLDDVPSPTLGRAAVVGVGVNVRLPTGSVPTALADQVAALEEFVRPPPALEDVEATVVGAVHGAVEWLSRARGVSEARALCRQLLFGVGRRVTVDGQPAGTLAELGDEGELWLATDTNRVAIWAGDVRVEDSP